MRNLISKLLFSTATILSINVSAQDGPGGVGTSTNNIIWLNGDSVSGGNNSPVSIWNDLSGNGINARQTNGSLQPVLKTTALNGHNAIEFTGSQYLIFDQDINSSAITTFVVYKNNDATSTRALYTFNKHMSATRSSGIETYYTNPFQRIKVSGNPGDYYVFSSYTGSAANGVDATVNNGLNSKVVTRNDFENRDTSSIGSRFNGTSHSLLFDGQVCELIVFDEELNSAQINIINNSLSAKYGLEVINQVYPFGSTHGHNVIGIGLEADGANTSAQGMDSILISNPSNLNIGEYLYVGHNNLGYGTSTSVPIGVNNRWQQVWRAYMVGDVGTVTVEIELGANGLTIPSNYVLLIDTVDGNFANGGTVSHTTGLFYNAGTNSITFTGVDFTDSAYFTLGALSSGITSIASTDWDNPSTWTCTCVPSFTDNVTIVSPFSVTVTGNDSVAGLTIENGGGLVVNAGDTLSVYSTMDIEGPLSFSTGTIAVANSSGNQIFTNTSGSKTTFFNLLVTNPDGLTLGTGGWQVDNNIQVISGSIDATTADSVVLSSDASSTCQILESASNSFIGDFIVQRFISTRDADYANFGIPISSATVAEWDDDLFISGIGGNDGNATVKGGGIFYSLYRYDRINDKSDTISSVATALEPGRGYEIYLADNITSFTGKTIDVVGTPNSGTIVYNGVNKGWNLLGNPYQSFIQYDSLIKSTWIPNNFYIYNTDNHQYDFFDGIGKAPIAPGQGFWIYKSSNGNKLMTFVESAKVNSNSSSFLRNKNQNRFSLKLTGQNKIVSNTSYIEFDTQADADIDNFDAYHLPSPRKDVPSISTFAGNSSEPLVKNVLNPFSKSQIIPIQIYSENETSYKLKTDYIDELYNHYSCIYLKDKKTNEVVDMLVESEINFVAESGISNRFDLILSNSYESCQSLISSNTVFQQIDNSLKLRNANSTWHLDYTLENDIEQIEVFIYNMNGQEVLSPIQFSASGSGTFPLNQFDNLNGIYLIRVKSSTKIINQTIKL